MLWPSFVGPAYRARSETIAADALVNLYSETTVIAQEAKKTTYYGTPGLKFFLTAPGGDVVCRGSFSQDGRTFSVIGDALYEIDMVGATVTNRGVIAFNSEPVSFASNGRGGEQLAIVGGGQLKIFNLVTNALSAAIVLPLTNAPVMIWFMDSYFLLLERDTVRVWFSAPASLGGGTSWSALDFFARSQTSDNLMAIAVVRNRLWLFGSLTSEVYYDSGDADNPFVPYPGSLMQEGLSARWAMTVFGEGVFWLAQDNQGRNRIVSGSDYQPTVVSTPPISFAIASYADITDCEVLAYEQEGHPFLAWSFPSGGDAGVTWCYDPREDQWHQRSQWNDALGIDMVWQARGLASTDQGLLVGDRTTGDLYTLDLDTFEDNEETIRRMRRAPYLSSENQWLRLDRFELGIQTGVGLASGQGVTPELMLSLSRDNGHTWIDAGTAGMGPMGEYDTRVIWRMLGRARADRLVLEVSQTDPVRAVWGPGAWIKARPGTGQL